MDIATRVKKDLETKLNTRIRDDWLRKCLSFLESSLSAASFAVLPHARLLTLVEEQFLSSTLNESSLGILPPNLRTKKERQQITGLFFVQVNDLVNIGEPLERRYFHSTHRTLKLSLFDGVQSVDAMELAHIPQLSVELPAGIKVRPPFYLTFAQITFPPLI